MKKMIEIDPAITSKRTWGGILVIVALVAQAAGYEFGAEAQEQAVNVILDGITAILALAGGSLSIWSKVKESKK